MGPIWGRNQTWCKCMVNLREFPLIDLTRALFGLVSHIVTPGIGCFSNPKTIGWGARCNPGLPGHTWCLCFRRSIRYSSRGVGGLFVYGWILIGLFFMVFSWPWDIWKIISKNAQGLLYDINPDNTPFRGNLSTVTWHDYTFALIKILPRWVIKLLPLQGYRDTYLVGGWTNPSEKNKISSIWIMKPQV